MAIKTDSPKLLRMRLEIHRDIGKKRSSPPKSPARRVNSVSSLYSVSGTYQSLEKEFMLKHINMVEVPGTSVVAIDPPGVAQFTRLLAPKTSPVFAAEVAADARVFSEVVAVTYRDQHGAPVHGGLFGFGADGVTSLALKDLEGKIDTSEEPAFVAMGILMMRGPLTFRQNDTNEVMDLSIIDLYADKLDRPLHAATAGREAVRNAYLSEVLPHANVVQPH